MTGYVHLHRDLLDHPAFRNDAEALSFAWMFARASWRPVRLRYKGHAISLARGQLAISIRDMAAAIDRDKAWVERLFKRLKSEKMIETQVETGVSIVTICNYDKFQPLSERGETTDATPRKTHGETRARQAQDTEQGREKGKKEKKIGDKPLSGAQAAADPIFLCPEGVDADHWRDYLTARRRKRCTNSPTAYAAVLRDLNNFADDDWPPGRLVQRSAEKGWASIINPHDQDTRHGHRNSKDGPANGNAMVRAVIAREAREGASGGEGSQF